MSVYLATHRQQVALAFLNKILSCKDEIFIYFCKVF